MSQPLGRDSLLRVCFAVVIAAVSLLAAGCTSAQVAAPEPDALPTVEPALDEPTAFPTPTPVPAPEELPIVIGVAMAESGVMAEYDRPALVGMQWQVDQINANGGVLGRDLALEVRDTQSRLSITEQVSEQLLESGIAALFVTCDAALARPAIDQANIRGVLTISPCGGDLEWNDLSLGLLSFTFGNSPFAEGVVMAQFALDRGWQTAVAIVEDTDPGAIAQCRGFVETFAGGGGSVVSNYAINYDLLDRFERRLDTEPVPGADVVALCSHLPGGLSGAPDTLDVLRARGVGARMLVGSSLDAPGWLRSVLDLGEVTIVSPAALNGDDPVPSVNQLVADLNDTTGLVVRGSTTFGADAVLAFGIVLQEVGELQGLLLAQALERFDSQQLISGPVSFSQSSHMDPNRVMRVIEATGGVPTFIETRAAR